MMKKKIDKRLTSLSFIVVLVVILLCTVFAMFSLRRMAIENQKEMNILLASKIHDRINNDLTEPIMAAQTMANNAFLFSFLTEDEKAETEAESIEKMKFYLSNLKAGLGYDSVFVVSANTNRYYTDAGLNKIVDPVNDPHDVWYSLFLEKNKEYDLDVDSDEVNNNVWTVFVNARVEYNGELLGVCGVGVKMTHLQSMFLGYEEEFGVKINMIDSNGLVQIDTNEINIENAYLTKIPISEKESSEYLYSKNPDSYSVSKYVENLGWYLVVQSTNTNLSDDYLLILSLNGGLFLVLALTFFLANHVTVRHTTRSIEAVKQQRDANSKAIERYREAERENISIINALGKIYYTLYYIDLEHQSAQEMSIQEDTCHQLSEKTTISEMKQSILENIASAEDRLRLQEFLQLDTLDERLRGRRSVATEFVTSDGGWTRCGLVPVDQSGDGKWRTVLCTMRKITREKQEMHKQELALREAYEAAEAANKAKTSFLFSMSHDIRTPMNAIIGFTRLLKEHRADKELFDEYISKIESSNDLLLSIINNVLDMARIESGKETVADEPFDMMEIKKEIIPLFTEQMKEKGIEFITRSEFKHRYIYADGTKIKNIYLNLLSNAYKYTPAGGTVKMTSREYPGDKPGFIILETVIEDTGIGMSKEFQETLFDLFSREHTTTQSRTMGTGLGMAIVKKLVDMMGGTIEVESAPGQGTRFTVRSIRRLVEDPSNYLEENYRSEIDVRSFEGKRILLAEDNDLNAEIAMAILEDAGFTVDRAEDGVVCLEMLEKAAAGYYDVVLMDIQMPNMDGYTATQRIRALPEAQKARIPVIAMTANAFDEDKKNAFAAGMNGHIAKPIAVEKLMSVLAEVLEMQQRR